MVVIESISSDIDSENVALAPAITDVCITDNDGESITNICTHTHRCIITNAVHMGCNKRTLSCDLYYVHYMYIIHYIIICNQPQLLSLDLWSQG